MSHSKNCWVSFDTGPVEEVTPSVNEPRNIASTGATRPQLSVPQPDHADRLPRSNAEGVLPDYWWLGVHGGAGESSLARLDKRTKAAGHHWPMTAAGATVILVARSNISGLRAAQLAATEWASRTVPGVHVVGLVVMADAPGRLPKEIREYARVVGGGVPHLWHVPWIEAWRLGHTVPPEDLPKEVRIMLEQVRIAATTTGT